LFNHVVLRVVAKFIIPFIMIYAFYVQLHGEYSPGGGFQAGVILAAAFILFCIIYGLKKTYQVVSINELMVSACLGALIYISVGFATIFMEGNFLNYSVLSENKITGQHIGITIIELGVGITVFSAMMLIFCLFCHRLEGKNLKSGAKR